jgi:HK97 gp10 family phage protein
MSIKIEGLDKLIKDLQKFEKDGAKAVIKNVTNTGTAIEEAAQRDAPKYFAGEKQNFDQAIRSQPLDGGFRVEVGLRDLDKKNAFAAWFEFGTGISAAELLSGPEYTDEIRKIAKEFLLGGDGTIKPRKYLFPNFFKESPKLIEKLKKDLNNLAKKV